MKKTLLLPLLLLATGLFAQTTRQNSFPSTGPMPNPPDPSVLGDFEPPVVTCINGLSANIMPTGAITLWASDILQFASDNATPANQIQLAIRKAGTGVGFPIDGQGNPLPNVVLTCDNLGTQTLELWAKDLAGNTAFCELQFDLQDNAGNCDGQTLPWLIEVCSITGGQDGIEEIYYQVSGTNPNEPFFATDLSDQYDNGCGYFDVPLGSDVVVAPIKDDNPLNGVTTYDLVLISKHIEGIELLNSPYKIIAADADRNGKIEAADVAELNKLILGIYTELPNNTSWRFVPENYVFPDPTNPFLQSFPETVSFSNIVTPVSALFRGIKVGDVNNTAVANFSGAGADERQSTSTTIIGQSYPNPIVETATLPIFLQEAENVYLEVSDLAGRIFWVNNLQLEKGSHSLHIPASALPNAGVYAWRVRAGEVTKSGKLVRQ